MLEKDLTPRKMEFKVPVTESQLQKIILDSAIELGLDGEWYFEHGYAHNNLVSGARCEKLSGMLRLPGKLHAVTEFKCGPWADASTEPLWGNIEFFPPYDCEQGAQQYSVHITDIHQVFAKNYLEITKSKT